MSSGLRITRKKKTYNSYKHITINLRVNKRIMPLD